MVHEKKNFKNRIGDNNAINVHKRIIQDFIE